MSSPRRIYCRVIGWMSRESVSLVVTGSPGVEESFFHPLPTITVAVEQVPIEKRFPNSIVWFDVTGDDLTYVDPDHDAGPMAG